MGVGFFFFFFFLGLFELYCIVLDGIFFLLLVLGLHLYSQLFLLPFTIFNLMIKIESCFFNLQF